MSIRTQTFFSEISVLADAEPCLGNAKGLQVSIRKSADVTVVHIWGRATWGHSASLGERLQELIAKGATKLLLDLTCLTQVDSSGVGAIVKAFVSVRSKGGDLRLLRPRGRVLEVLRLLCLQEIISCDEHECLALASFRLMGSFASP